MRTYDPAERIVYVHPGQEPGPASRAHDECDRLPADYANASLRARLGDVRASAGRPRLVVLPGGSAAAAGQAPAAPALRLAR
ncbi:hypothetical protein GCU56_16495 [Geodermatophilus sabuli]|uniref:Uncharacterized protein n=1 Tax=Geodermatophilus sabuli TaxID=1564158 RepID=A0A7K3W3J5_9ACTN|nr:hypothetical protein [Geodermatophilus sabuli]NEK59459.1 hypothetical protein [Geodermatophilus sabuli]